MNSLIKTPPMTRWHVDTGQRVKGGITIHRTGCGVTIAARLALHADHCADGDLCTRCATGRPVKGRS